MAGWKKKDIKCDGILRLNAELNQLSVLSSFFFNALMLESAFAVCLSFSSALILVTAISQKCIERICSNLAQISQ